MPTQGPASHGAPTRPSRRSRALAAFPWVLLACALALFGFAAYVALRYAEAATGATAGTAGTAGAGVWGQFGFLMGGILGPALGFLTVVGLAMTLLTQLHNAAEDRRDAELMRQEAELRSRPAFLEVKLAALSTLINAANHEIYRAGGSTVEQRQIWDDRKKAFLEEMEATFATLKSFDAAQAAVAPADPASPAA